MSVSQQILGHGFYSIAEAALYTGVNSRRIHYLFGSRRGQRVMRSDYARLGYEDSLSFLNLIEILVAGKLREENVPLQEIRTAHKLLKKDLGTQHPFAHSNLYTHDKRVFAKVQTEMQGSVLYQVVKRQVFHEELVKQHLKRVEYDPHTKMAARWNIEDEVVIDPAVTFGQPVIKGTRINTWVLDQQYRANGCNANFVGEWYGVSAAEVMRAVRFEQELRGRLGVSTVSH